MGKARTGKCKPWGHRLVIVGAVAAALASGTGCSHSSDNGGGPEVLQKKFPGAAGQQNGAAKAPATDQGKQQ